MNKRKELLDAFDNAYESGSKKEEYKPLDFDKKISTVKYLQITEDQEISPVTVDELTFDYCTYPTELKVEVVGGEPTVKVWSFEDGVEMWREIT